MATTPEELKFARNLSKHRPKFIRYLRCTECLPELIDVLGLDEVTVCKIHEKSFNSAESDANQHFILELERSHAPGKWIAFISALESLGYEMLSKLLKGEPVCPRRDYDVKLIQLFNGLISHKLCPRDIIPELWVAGCLNERDVQNIGQRTRAEGLIAGTEVLLDRVTRRKDDWFLPFMTALKNAGYHELMREVDLVFAEKLLGGGEIGVEAADISAELCPFDLDDLKENANMDGSVELSFLQNTDTELLGDCEMGVEATDVSADLCPFDLEDLKENANMDGSVELSFPQNTDTELLCGGEIGVEATDMSAELCPFDLEDLKENANLDGSVELSFIQNTDTGGRCTSPTLARPKELFLRDYQQELYLQVDNDRDTAIICLIKSGKRFVLLKHIQNHFSSSTSYEKKILYLVTSETLSEKVFRRCQVFLSHISSISFSAKVARQQKRSLCDVMMDNQVVVVTGKLLYQALKEESISFHDFSVVILELDIDYYEEYDHVYKNIMPYYRIVDAKCRPQVVLASPSLCGDSYYKDIGDMNTAFEKTCGDFEIQAIALVHKNIDTLQQFVSMPFTEQVHVECEQWWDKVYKIVVNIIVSVEECCMFHPALADCRELRSPPNIRGTVQYEMWLSYTQDLIRRQLPRRKLLERNVCGLGISRNPFLGFIDELLSTLKFLGFSTDVLFRKFRDNISIIDNLGLQQPLILAIKKKLVEIYRNNPHGSVIVVCDSESSGFIADTLRKVVSLQRMGHPRVTEYAPGTYRLVKGRFNVLVASSVLLTRYPYFNCIAWDCLIAMNVDENILTVLQQKAPSDTPCLSQFTYPGAEPPTQVDLINEFLLMECTTTHQHDLKKKNMQEKA